MKLVKKAINSARKRQIRNKGRAERGKISNTFASFFDSIPTTAEGPNGHDAYQKACADILTLMKGERLFVTDQNPGNVSGKFNVTQINDITDLPHDNGIKAFGLWLDAESSLNLPEVSDERVSNCVVLNLELTDLRPRDKSSTAIPVLEYLLGHGFEPVLRSDTNDGGTFNLCLAHRDLPDGQVSAVAEIVDKAVDPDANLLPIHNRDIPVYIPCFNNQTYCRHMVEQLVGLGFENVTLIDNASTNPEMHDFLDEVEGKVNVDRLPDNMGPKNSVFTPERYASMPRHFCVTDPDIVFNRFLPKDFIAQLIEQTQIHQSGKAGFALNIAHRQFFKDSVVTLLYQDWSIWEWEERYWPNYIARTRSNDRVYRTGIDTTFAVYDKERWQRRDFHNAVRVAGRFTALHSPWYRETDVPEAERETYQREGRYSYYKM